MALTTFGLVISLALVGELFVALSLVSSAFLAPALAALADTLALDEPTAGVTLLALGNAAPDAAGALAAVRRGAAQLALGELLGAAAFVGIFVSGVVILAACPLTSGSNSQLSLPRRSFARDIASLALGVSGALAGIVFNAGFALHGCLAFLFLYALYASDVLAPPVGLRFVRAFWRRRRRGAIHLPENGQLPLPIASTISTPGSLLDRDDARDHALALGAPHSLLTALEFRDVVAHLDLDAGHARDADTAPHQDALARGRPRPSLTRFSSDGAVPRLDHDRPRWSAQAWRNPDPSDLLSSSSDGTSDDTASNSGVVHLPDPSTPSGSQSVPMARTSSSTSQQRHSRLRLYRLALLPAWPVIWGRGGESWSTRLLALLSTPPLFFFLLTIPIPASAEQHAQAQARDDAELQEDDPTHKSRDMVVQAEARAAARAAARAVVLPPLHAGFVPGFVVWSIWPASEEGASSLERLASWMGNWAFAPLHATWVMDHWSRVVDLLTPVQAALIMCVAGWVVYAIQKALVVQCSTTQPISLPDDVPHPSQSPTSAQSPTRRRHPTTNRPLSNSMSTHSLHALRDSLSPPPRRSQPTDDTTADEEEHGLQPPIVLGYAAVESPPEYERLPIHFGADAVPVPEPSTRPFVTTSRRWRQVAPLALAFATSVLWINATSNQLVDLLEALGETLNVSEAVLGATVFAFGNSLGDLVANMALARVYPHMALAACFATPLLNLTFGVGLAGSLTLLFPSTGTQDEGKVTVHPTPPLLIAGGGCIVSLSLLCLYLTRFRWTLSRRVGIALIAAYALMFSTGLLFEVFTSYSSALPSSA